VKTVKQVMAALKEKGDAQTRKTYARHGAPENMFGVKVADMKVIAKQIKGNQDLAYELFDTGNCDARYLAGLVADGSLMTRSRLNQWARDADWTMVSDWTVAWVASENVAGTALALKWMKAKKESVASTGWATYSSIVSTIADEDLDFTEIRILLKTIATDVHSQPDRVRVGMNRFVIAVGTFVAPLTKQAKTTAKKIGKVTADMGDTACKIPDALAYIEKNEKMGRIGQKRKAAKC